MSIGDGLQDNLERASALVAMAVDGKAHNFDDELLAFIRRPELRRVAESVVQCVPSFSRTSVLRKLLEADEALGRALSIDLAWRAAQPMSSDLGDDIGDPPKAGT